MNIGEVAQLSGVPAKTIRYYEEVGLIPPAQRSEAGYRRFGKRDLSTLRFVQRARSLGFTVKEVSSLLALWQDKARASSEVKALAGRHCARIDAKIVELQSMRRTLDDLMTRCHGDGRPDCPILDDLAGGR
ncbi:MAG: Cu(I)-responsive transcriptional regulator [Alphaproteobacteria bacterium]